MSDLWHQSFVVYLGTFYFKAPHIRLGLRLIRIFCKNDNSQLHRFTASLSVDTTRLKWGAWTREQPRRPVSDRVVLEVGPEMCAQLCLCKLSTGKGGQCSGTAREQGKRHSCCAPIGRADPAPSERTRSSPASLGPVDRCGNLPWSGRSFRKEIMFQKSRTPCKSQPRCTGFDTFYGKKYDSKYWGYTSFHPQISFIACLLQLLH